MRNEQGRDPELLLDPTQFDLHRLPELLVETRERFVKQQDVRLGGHRPGERDSLLLSAGELVWLPVGSLGQLNEFEHFLDALFEILAVPAADLEPVGDVLGNRLVREQREVLEHHPDIAPVGRHAVHPVAADADHTFSDLLEARDCPECRRLAAATRSNKRHELSLFNHQRDSADSFDTARILFCDSFQYDPGHPYWSSTISSFQSSFMSSSSST